MPSESLYADRASHRLAHARGTAAPSRQGEEALGIGLSREPAAPERVLISGLVVQDRSGTTVSAVLPRVLRRRSRCPRSGAPKAPLLVSDGGAKPTLRTRRA